MAEKKLKTIVTADTSDFKKGMKDARTALKDFEKDGTGALSSISSMFGVSSNAIGEVVKNLGQASNAFKLLGSAGEGSTKAITMGMKALSASIAGLGIMAAVAAFRQLNAEAANFEQRLQGVNLAASAKAARETYRQAMYDASGAGEKWAKFTEWAKTDLSRGWTNLVTGVLGGTNAADIAQADIKAARAAELASQMVDYRREQRDLSLEIQRIDNQIAEAQNKFRDSSASVAERKQAEATITELISEKYAKQADLQGRMLANVKERNSLTSSTEAELDEEANLEKGILSLQGQQQQELNSMLRMHNSINKAASQTATAAKEEAEATLLTLDAATKLVEKQRELKAIQDQNSGMMSAARFRLDGGLANPNAANLQGQATTMKVVGLVKPQYDPQEWIDVSQEISGIIEDALNTVGESIGQLMGDLATGGDAWGNFTNSAISAFGDMAMSVGKIAISTGVAALGIQAALKSLNPYVAIAAGTALVALGAAVKAGMSNIASGGGYSSSVASSSYASGTYGAVGFGREMNVKVTGTLTANGSQLVAVLNNENDRKNYTT